MEQVISSLVPLPAAQVLYYNPEREEAYERLLLVKALMLQLMKAEQQIHQRLVEAIRFIEVNELWKADADADGNTFPSMSRYLPFLLSELKAAGYIDTPGVRQLRQWLAAEKVLIAPGILDWEQVQELGIGVVEKVLAATAYDSKTGEMLEEVPEGSKKLNKSQALGLLDEIAADRENWSVGEVTRVADERRGVERQRVYVQWVRSIARTETDELTLRDVIWYIGDTALSLREGPLTHEQARAVTKLMNAGSNLPEEL